MPDMENICNFHYISAIWNAIKLDSHVVSGQNIPNKSPI